MRLLFLGPPGAGKGTQAKMIAEKFGLLHIAPGDIFRQEVKEGTELGRLVEGIMARGQLVPDDITVRIIEKRLNSPEAQKGFVLDGFPRNLAQAEALKSILEEKGQHLDLVIDLLVPQEELLDRSRTRRVCSKCGRSYNLKLNPPKVEGKCNVCGGDLVTRQDDKEDTVRERFRVYHEETEPLREYYMKSGILVSIDGCGEVECVCKRVIASLSDRGLIKEAIEE
ncbi:MAG: adenylate kinase [Firmicutes bacterium]|nr:adenylate kinase [Candidatus Fermentithermobacillaceae bacterium]HON87261.1 adenylate kinase [Bacillota bacterium]